MIRRLVRWLQISRILLRTYGWRGIARRVRHEIRSRSDSYLAHPRFVGAPVLAPSRVVYRPCGPWTSLPEGQRASAVERGRRVVEGWYQAYGADWRKLPSAPQEWHRHPATGFEFSMAAWWRVHHVFPGIDVKDVWEPGRFAWVYDLVRAHAVSGERTFAEAFCRWFDGWHAANPPFRGPHWACGQETAIRTLALLHAEDALPLASVSSETVQRLTSTLIGSAERIADGIGYALSQRNNHGISESACLIHLGLRLQGAHPQASRWLDRGVTLLDEQIRDQFSPDGWYAQHSFNYMRVALEQAIYAERALRAVGRSLPEAALARLDASLRLITELVDARTGELPNHGANDGARVLPLSSTAHRDFRPLLTLAAVIRGTELPSDIPVDAETTWWLGQAPRHGAAARADGVLSGDSGWAIARLHGWHVFLRAGRYAHRPSHLDMLHIDVRREGQELIADAGTFAYNAPEPWNNSLSAAAVHNGPVLDREEPARRGPRFLWLSWPEAHLLSVDYRDQRVRISAERPGVVRRDVDITADEIRVIDRALDPSAGTIGVTWLLHPAVADRNVVAAERMQRLRATEGETLGWFSPTYGVRQASCVVRVRSDAQGAAPELHTLIRPDRA